MKTNGMNNLGEVEQNSNKVSDFELQKQFQLPHEDSWANYYKELHEIADKTLSEIFDFVADYAAEDKKKIENARQAYKNYLEKIKQYILKVNIDQTF